MSKLVVRVSACTDENVLAFLNSNKEVLKIMAMALKKIYRYEGAFSFEEDSLPF